MRKYVATFLMGIKDAKVYQADFYLSFISVPVELIVIFLFWSGILSGSSSEFCTEDIVAYFLFMQVLQLGYSPTMYVTYELFQEINNGTIITWIMRPITYPIYVLAQKFSQFLLNTSVAVLVSLAISSFLGYRISLICLLLGVLAIVGGNLLLFELQFLIGALTFWLKNVITLRDVVMNILFVIGGTMIPIDMTPLLLQKITVYTPISFIYFLPAKILSNQYEIELIFKSIILQFFWVIILGIVIMIVWQEGIRDKVTQGS